MSSKPHLPTCGCGGTGRIILDGIEYPCQFRVASRGESSSPIQWTSHNLADGTLDLDGRWGAALTIPPLPEHAPDEQMLDFVGLCGFGMWLPHLHLIQVDNLKRAGHAYLRKWHPTDPQVADQGTKDELLECLDDAITGADRTMGRVIVPYSLLRDLRERIAPGTERMCDCGTCSDCAVLHEREAHPDYEYATTDGPRKNWWDSDVPPKGEGWVRNKHLGRDGWDRFEYHEESYWMRRKDPQ